MTTPRIIAIVLIKNEDLFIETVLRNIFQFCDRIHVADNHSTDGTADIVRRLAAQYPKIEYRTVDHPSESHDWIAGYAGEPNWLFGVDGDEVYDPVGLMRFRSELLAGVHNRHFKLMGNVLNVRLLDRAGQTARGSLCPPCRSMTKLYNFGAINAWPPPCPERLHGGNIEYKSGYNPESCRLIHKDFSWEDSPFRCLHLCFTHRSSLDQRHGDKVKIRKGVGEGTMWSYNLRSRILSFFGREDIPYFKRDFYMRGPLVEKDIRSFSLPNKEHSNG